MKGILLFMSDFSEYINWTITGIVGVLLGVVWFAAREWIKSVKTGFGSIFDRLEKLIDAIDKIDSVNQLQSEQISNLLKKVEDQEKKLDTNYCKIIQLEKKQIACKNFELKKYNGGGDS